MALVHLGEAAGRTRWTVEDADGHTYAVFVLDDGYLVTDAACPHRGGPLVDGEVRRDVLVCPWHRYKFDLRDGLCRTTRRHRMRRYPVHEIDGALVAEVPSSA